MTRITLAAATLLTALAPAAFAASPGGPTVTGDADSLEVTYDAPSANIVGGALVRVTGPAGQRSVQVLGAERTQPRGPARPVGQSIVVDSAS